MECAPLPERVTVRFGSAWLAACLVLALPLPTASGAGGDATAAEAAAIDIASCLARNVPQRTSEQYLEITSVDPTGGERTTRVKVLAKRFDDGLRRLVLRFRRPPTLDGVALLMMESREGASQTFVYSPELRTEIRVNTSGGGDTLLGTDFSYQDFARWQQLGPIGPSQRLPDEELAGRRVMVVESRAGEGRMQEYERVVSYIDAETCVVLRSEAYEAGASPRKVLVASPESVIEEGGIHIATEIRMEDLRDQSHTLVLIEDLAVDREIDDREFMISRLGRRSRGGRAGG